MWATIWAWLLKAATGDFLGRVIDLVAKTEAGKGKLEEIRARTQEHLSDNAVAAEQNRAAAANARALAKLNMPVFWVMVAAMLGPPLLILWGVALYNILWWENGVWPQPWAIADFPASIKPWANAAVDWLYDPLGPPSGIGSSLAAAWLTRK